MVWTMTASTALARRSSTLRCPPNTEARCATVHKWPFPAPFRSPSWATPRHSLSAPAVASSRFS
eukprot:11200147-Lingulodinium_polyedra.AAC.1